MNKQKLALFIILIVLVLAVTWSILSAPKQKTVTSLKRPAGQAQQVEKVKAAATGSATETTAKPATKTAAVTEERTLRLDLLDLEQSGFKGYRRNIFRPIFLDDIKLMKQKAAAFKPLPVAPVPVVAPKPASAPPAVEPETHQSTLSHFTFLGFLKKDNRKTIFLSKDKQIVLVRKGESFAKRYEATEITDQALTIKVTDTGEEIVIPLTENRPLSAAMRK